MPDYNFDPITNLAFEEHATSERLIRIEFYNKVLNAIPNEPQVDLRNLCSAWLEATGAEWVWLWLRHEDGQKRPWELTSVLGRQGNQGNYVPEKWDKVALRHENSVAEYCSKLKQPILVTELAEWERKIGDIIYRVICKEELLSRNCRSFLAVPLLFPRSQPGAKLSPYLYIGDIRGLICSHFTTDIPAQPYQFKQSYMLMGRATTQAIAASFAAEQHRILFELDLLATRFLTKTETVIDDRRKYLAEVIRLIKTHLRVTYVSVFYETSFDNNQIECIASTGLRSDIEVLNSGDDLTKANYNKGENITGKVFESGVPFISEIGQAVPRSVDRARYKWTERPDSISESTDAWVIYPIKTPETDPNDPKSSRILGVLRCVGNESMLGKPGIGRNFDPIQIQTLDFISRQIAPVLETMAIQIDRERTITIIKHDLFGPLNLMEAQTDNMRLLYNSSKPIPQYGFSNIKAALILAKNLARSLSEKKDYTPAPTRVEGDIVAMLVDGLRSYARGENRMSIEYQNVREVFPRYMFIDRDLIERALTNLLINAIKYGYPETTIVVAGESSESNYLLNVSNFGIGIEEKEKTRIFEGTYRSPKAILLKQGLGLGLKIARAAMRRHGGDLRVTNLSTPTTFTMIFPKRLATDVSLR